MSNMDSAGQRFGTHSRKRSDHEDSCFNNYLSSGFEHLVSKIAEHDATKPVGEDVVHYDLLIIGSGYGGAIAADTFCLPSTDNEQTDLRVCVLERGKEYLPGSFPSRMSELPRTIRGAMSGRTAPMGEREALFDFRINGDVSTLVANGLGGGSLINAGVMLRPNSEVFDHRWPEVYRDSEFLNAYFNDCMDLLGARVNGKLNTASTHHGISDANPLNKQIALKNLGASRSHQDAFCETPITVAMQGKATIGGTKLDACRLCGDCATGCNHNAKESLDTNLLARAAKNGCEIFTGGVALKLQKEDSHWVVFANYTQEPLALRQGNPVKIRSKNVIIAAGSLGSTELLKKSQSETLQFSNQLGKNFSSNGDMISVAYNQKDEVNAVAEETSDNRNRHIGPTITGMLDYRNHERFGDLLVQEMAVPGPMKKIFSENVTTMDLVQSLFKIDCSNHTEDTFIDGEGQPKHSDPLAVDDDKIKRTNLFAMMSRDDNEEAGELILPDGYHPSCEGLIQPKWTALKHNPIFTKQRNALSTMLKKSGSGGRALMNGAWDPIPKGAKGIFDINPKGPLFTVHPLGGCVMASNKDTGVVDDIGRVFDLCAQSKTQLHEGLAVLDGAMIPTSLGANPALTISAVALYAARKLRCHWMSTAVAKDQEPGAGEERPRYRLVPDILNKQPTEVIVREVLSGFTPEQDGVRYRYELNLEFASTPLDSMLRPFKNSLNSTHSQRVNSLAIYSYSHNDTLRTDKPNTNSNPIVWYEVSGTLKVFDRESSNVFTRLNRSLKAAAQNYGICASPRGRLPRFPKKQRVDTKFLRQWLDKSKNSIQTGWRMARNSCALGGLLSHSGETRTFVYDLNIREKGKKGNGLPLRATKRLTYAPASNPWQQMSEVVLEQFPTQLLPKQKLEKEPTETPLPIPDRLCLDIAEMSRRGLHLLNFSKQETQVDALADLFSMGAYMARQTLNTHLFSFAKAPKGYGKRQPDWAPADLGNGVQPSFIKTIPCPVYRAGGSGTSSAQINLTRYQPNISNERPILLIHGYSTSGNTFTHKHIPCSLAQHLYDTGRDVWVVDLRTSTVFRTAEAPWTFEDVAFEDIPRAVDFICSHTGSEKIDILAHCMGGVMLSMAILGCEHAGEDGHDQNRPEHVNEQDWTALCSLRKQLPSRIHKAIFSQAGPTPIMSPMNTFRAYLAQYALHLADSLSYSFTPQPNESMFFPILDNLLNTLPYKAEEYWIERGKRDGGIPPFAQLRHRMDALYGNVMHLPNLPLSLYDSLDDLFGPLSMKTIRQIFHFAQHGLAMASDGTNKFVQRETIRKNWPEHTISIHGVLNGLLDPKTANRAQSVLKDGGKIHKTYMVDGFGHQDCLIGNNAKTAVFNPIIDKFLEADSSVDAETDRADERETLNARVPEIGPLRVHSNEQSQWQFKIKPDKVNPLPSYKLVIPVRIEEGQITSIIDENTGSLKVAYVEPASGSSDEWEIVELSLKENPTEDGYLSLFIYNSSPQLRNPLFQQAPFGLMAYAFQNAEKESYPILMLTITNKLWSPYLGIPQDEAIENWIPPQQIMIDVKHEIETAVRQYLDTLQTEIRNSVIWVKDKTLLSCDSKQPTLNDNTLFAVTSCQYPPGMLDNELAYESASDLAKEISLAPSKLKYTFLLGDQLYADATAGLFDPTSLEDRFCRPYENWLRQPPIKTLFKQTEVHTQLDDHEIDNNVEPINRKFAINEDTAGKLNRYLRDGYDTFRLYQRAHMAEDTKLFYEGMMKSHENHYYPFFMANTRAERQNRTATTVKNADMMAGPIHEIPYNPRDDGARSDQFQMLEQFVRKYANHSGPVFIMSPSALFPRERRASGQSVMHTDNNRSGIETPSAIHSDAWDGYPSTLRRLLTLIYEVNANNLIFVSGDHHISSHTHITLSSEHEDKVVVIHSLHSSGLYAPYPFANAVEADFVKDDRFKFAPYDIETSPNAARRTTNTDWAGKEISCHAISTFYPGDGYALISCERETSTTKISCAFMRHNKEKAKQFDFTIPLSVGDGDLN